MFGEGNRDAKREMYLEEVRQWNLSALKEMSFRAGGETRGVDIRSVGYVDRDCISLPLDVNGEGRILKHDAGRKVVKPLGLTPERLVMALPVADFRKKPEKEEPVGVLAFVDGPTKKDAVNSEKDTILQESLFMFNVKEAKTLKDLFAAIDLFNGKIYFSGEREVTKDYLKSIIIQVMEGKKGIEFVTSSYGLREKVIGLLSGEKK